MGKIETTYDDARNLSIVKATGKMTAMDFYKWTQEYYSGKITLLILWDMSEADLSDVPATQFWEGMDEIRKWADSRAGGKTALVFSADSDFGIGRMDESISEIK